MLQILYTDTDFLRSLLGVSEKDLPDKRLIDRNLEKELSMDITSWMSNHAAISNLVNMGTATESEVATMDAITMYSAYFCAKLIIPSLQLGVAQAISDGKNSMDRFSAVDWDKLNDRMSERVAFYKKIAQGYMSLPEPSQTTFSPFSIANPASDPVTNTA